MEGFFYLRMASAINRSHKKTGSFEPVNPGDTAYY